MKRSPSRRLAREVQQLLGCSYSRARREVEVGHVLVDGAVITDPGCQLAAASMVTHNPNLPRLRPEVRVPPLPLLHADEAILVAAKPAGLLVHPTVHQEGDTALTRAASALARISQRPIPPLVVHRLDRDTSGVLVLARTPVAARNLQRQFRAHTVSRRYQALVLGDLDQETLVEAAIGRPGPGLPRRALPADGGGRPALTLVRPVTRFGAVTLVEAEPRTGRTHQIRIHLAALGHPVLGDTVYGRVPSPPVVVPRLALHATRLGFVHPVSGQWMSFETPWPEDLNAALKSLGPGTPVPPGRGTPPTWTVPSAARPAGRPSHRQAGDRTRPQKSSSSRPGSAAAATPQRRRRTPPRPGGDAPPGRRPVRSKAGKPKPPRPASRRRR